MQIPVKDLCAASELIIAELRSSGKEYIEFPIDWYWELATVDRFSFTKAPTQFLVGDLTDDWSHVSSILRDELMPFGLSFIVLAAILRALGEQDFV